MRNTSYTVGALAGLALVLSLIYLGSGGEEPVENPELRYNLLSGEKNWVSQDEVPEPNSSEQIVEVSRYSSENSSEKFLENAWELYSKSFEQARDKGWFNVSKGTSEGYRRVKGSHYPNEKFLYDSEVLNPEKPEYLMYHNTSEGYKLTGIMFMEEKIGEVGRQPGGPFTVWHYHMYNKEKCFRNQVFITDNYSLCSEEEMSNTSPQMIHVWFTRRPEKGQFATDMGINTENISTEKLSREAFFRQQRNILEN